MRRAHVAAVGVLVAATALTAAHAARPALFAVPSPASSAVIETAAATAALLLACLAYGRWRQRALLVDLLVCYGIAVLAAAKVVFVLAPVLAGRDAETPGLQAAALISGLVAGLLLLGAGVVPWAASAASRRPSIDLTVLLAVVLSISLGIAVLGSITSGTLGDLHGFVSTEATNDRGDVAVTVLQLGTALVFALVAVVLVRRGLGRLDRSFAWLAAACTAWAFARVNFALTPPRLSDWLTVGDWMRVAGYAVLVVGGTLELRAYWSRLADGIVLEERRRVARELHDGLAQELAFIATQTSALTRLYPDSQRHELLLGASERALDESRRAIAALTRPTDEPLHVTLAQTAEEVAGRLGARVHLELEPHVRVPGDVREGLLRITREAVTNAVRHGEAPSVTVRLLGDDGITLQVRDNGRGFDPDDARHRSGRLGLQSMRERASAMGGTFEVRSRPYRGTEVTVHVP